MFDSPVTPQDFFGPVGDSATIGPRIAFTNSDWQRDDFDKVSQRDAKPHHTTHTTPHHITPLLNTQYSILNTYFSLLTSHQVHSAAYYLSLYNIYYLLDGMYGFEPRSRLLHQAVPLTVSGYARMHTLYPVALKRAGRWERFPPRYSTAFLLVSASGKVPSPIRPTSPTLFLQPPLPLDRRHHRAPPRVMECNIRGHRLEGLRSSGASRRTTPTHSNLTPSSPPLQSLREPTQLGQPRSPQSDPPLLAPYPTPPNTLARIPRISSWQLATTRS